MNSLLNRFLNSNENNKFIYKKALSTNDEYYKKILLDRFYNYVFKINFISYIEKSIRFKSYEIKNKKVMNKELCILNETDENFKEEKINNLRDEPIDFLEDISREQNLKNISTNQTLINALEKLTDRQRLVIFMYFIQNKEEKQIAKDLNVTKQSINKVKLAGLKRLKKYIKNVKHPGGN